MDKEYDSVVANSINMSLQAFSNRKKKKSIPFSEYIELATTLGINASWLFFGVGSPYINKPEKQIDQPSPKKKKLTLPQNHILI